MAQTAMTTNLPSIVNSPGRPADYSPVRIDHGRNGANSALAMSATKPLRNGDSLPSLAKLAAPLNGTRNNGRSVYDSIERI